MKRRRFASFPRSRCRARAALGGLLGAALLGVMACTPIPRARTLPPTIRSVYVPMFTNATSEPGLEEKATRAVQRQFLADGRMRLEQKSRADAWIECTIKAFEHRPSSFSTDDFPTFREMRIQVDILVRENIPTTPLLGGTRQITAIYSYPSDLRRSIAMQDVEAVEQLLEDMARLTVREVLTGEYGDEADRIPPAPASPSSVSRQRPDTQTP
jgi:hypothetical protein